MSFPLDVSFTGKGKYFWIGDAAQALICILAAAQNLFGELYLNLKDST